MSPPTATGKGEVVGGNCTVQSSRDVALVDVDASVTSELSVLGEDPYRFRRKWSRQASSFLFRLPACFLTRSRRFSAAYLPSFP